MRLLLVLSAIVVAAPSGSVAAAPPPYAIQGDRSIGGIRLYESKLADATARFGKPRSTRVEWDSCVAAWPRIGLVVNFFTFEGWQCKQGGALIATITSRTSWRTGFGLRVGDSVARLRALYPRAKLRSGSYSAWNGYWLVTRHACAEVGGSAYPGLLARLRGGRVSALVVSGTVCD